MIIKLTDRLDLQILEHQMRESIPQVVIDTIKERFDVLEEAFGSPHLKNSYGFNVVYIITEDTKDAEEYIEEILNFYHLKDSISEYTEYISAEGNNYQECCYLFGESSLILLQAMRGKEKLKYV